MRIVGQMSGTSADGIDLAEVDTDGRDVATAGATLYAPYDPALREAVLGAAREAARMPGERLRRREAWPSGLHRLERRLTDANADALRRFPVRFELVGYHGQTVHHRPEEGISVQLGDGERLARALGVPVVWDFRRADIEAGGQGAPLAPFYHHAVARSKRLGGPCAVVNLGGVANVSFVDPSVRAPEEKGALLAFDTGPGCALIDAWIERHGAGTRDEDGALAARGRVMREPLAALLEHPYLERPPPKSLDREAFSLDPLAGCSLGDGAATLAALTAAAVAGAARWAESPPLRWHLCGGGRRNAAVAAALGRSLGSASVGTVEALGLDGDFLEAQAFAYLARRSLDGLPLSTSSTTGCALPVSGGRLAVP